MKSAVGYVRVSGDKQVKGESLEIQRIEIEEYCNSKGYELIELYDDKGWSGAKSERPAFQKMMLDARFGKFETVVVYDHSRFSRDLTDTMVCVRELQNNGVEFIALRENIETQDKSVQEMVRIILGATYQHERRKTMERTFDGKEKKRKERRCFIGKQPFGYIWNKEKERFEINEAIEITKIFSVVGMLSSDQALITRRTFRSPHHTISDAGLIGGGHIPRPGEVSLAHNGVLFLDELSEYKKHVLEVLRQPLEDQHVTISRAASTLTYPSNFMLIAAMNPCPCGYLSDPKHECRCTHSQLMMTQAAFWNLPSTNWGSRPGPIIAS